MKNSAPYFNYRGKGVPHGCRDEPRWMGNDLLLMSCFETVDTTTDPMRIIMDQLRRQITSLDHVIIAD